MDTRSRRILAMLKYPKYESTQGLSKDLRKKAIENYQGNSFLNPNDLGESHADEPETKRAACIISPKEPVVQSSEVPFILSQKLDGSGNAEKELKANTKIKVLSQIVIRGPDLSVNNTDLHASTNKDFKNMSSDVFPSTTSTSSWKRQLSNSDSMSEPKTSGSEYLPSDDDNSSLEIEELTFLENKKKNSEKNYSVQAKTITSTLKSKKHNQKRVKKTDHKEKVVKSEVTAPDSTTLLDSEIVVPFSISSDTSVKSRNIVVSVANKKEGKLIRNKTHACYFCQKKVQNMARHFELIHKNEIEVGKLLAKPKGTKERREGFVNLIRAGDFYYNTDVLSTKSGKLILVRRPTENESKFVTWNDYGPCPYCLGFMLKKHLWHHVKSGCSLKKGSDVEQAKHIIAESEALLNVTFGYQFSRDFVTNISSKLRDDEIGIYCREDILIQRFGALLFEKYGTTQCELIRQSMRQLARLTLKLREIANTKKNLSDYLVPQMFDLVIQATKSLCVSHQNSVRRPEFEIPSLALKIGYTLKKCANIKRGSCLRAGNLSENETLISFLNLMELEWSSRISSNALATLYNRKLNSTQLLPLTSDLIKLSQYLNKEISKARVSLSGCPSDKNWFLLASLTLSKVIVFNKRRSGEAARMTKSDYFSRPKWKNQCTDELKKSLTDFERKLAEQLTLVEIIGKRGRKVPVLLTEDIKEAIEALNQTRDEINIPKENPYIFARSRNSELNMRGHDCLRKVCSNAGLEQAENFTSTKLRKYIATVCQVFNLSENDYDWLAKHLGHDIRVHREFYRLHESAVELTKVSRLLMVVEKEQVNKFAGKRLDEINLEGN